MRFAPAAVLAAVLGLEAVYAWPFSIDDAFITARYAQRLARGLGYTYNDGSPTDGVTGPLWLIPSLAGELLGSGALVVAKLVATVAVVLAATAVVVALRQRQQGQAASWLATAFMASSLPLVIAEVNGLETGAATLALTAGALCAEARPLPRALGCGVACALIPWLRPELVIAASAVLFSLWLRDPRAGTRAALLGLAGLASVALFRFIMFGTPIPLSAVAKPSELGHGVRYLLALVARSDTVIACGLIIAAGRWGRRRERALIAVLLAHGVAVTLAGGDWMPGRRLFAPAVPLAAYVFAMGSAAAWRRLGRARRPLVASALAVYFLLASFELVREAPAARAAGLSATLRARQLAALLQREPGPIAALDIGALGHRTGATMVDLAGLTDPELAKQRGGHLTKRIAARWLEAKAPTWLVLHSRRPPVADAEGRLTLLDGYPLEQALARTPFVRAQYRLERTFEFAADYYYALLLRRDRARTAPAHAHAP